MEWRERYPGAGRPSLGVFGARWGARHLSSISFLRFSVLFLFIFWAGCGATSPLASRDYRQEMRNFVQNLSAYAKKVRPGFIVIPQNGHELLLQQIVPERIAAIDYLKAIDAVGQESLFYGYTGDDQATPPDVQRYTASLLDVAKRHGAAVLVIDYCATPARVDDSYRQNLALGYVSLAADRRTLDNIPAYPARPVQVSQADIRLIPDVRNFLYLINPGAFSDRHAFLNAIRETDYDLVIVDLFFGRESLTEAEVASLRTKANGGTRLVVAYMSIGEAEDYRYYWQLAWAQSPPAWLAEQNSNWPGNYKVRYWDVGWQDLIYGLNGAYLQRILDAGFDGVYLDIIDAYAYFESGGK